MQELNQQAFDIKVFSSLGKVPFGENVKEYFLKEFRETPESWDSVFKGGGWSLLDTAAKTEREAILDQALEKFNIKRAIFDM